MEFNCPHCQTLLRVPEDSAGRQAKCPKCAQVVTIPDRPPEPPLAEAAEPISADSVSARPAASDNPFAAPTYQAVIEGSASMDESGRTGPPWERDGASVQSFIETVKLTGFSTQPMFDTMRRVGGLGMPLLFAIVGGTIGGVAYEIYEFVFRLAVGWNPFGIGRGFRGGFFMGDVMWLGCWVVLMPLLIAVGSFISSGIIHLMLVMLDGAKQPFETTFRVDAYATGVTWLLLAIPIPCLNSLAANVAYVVVTIIGLSRAHGISGGKAAAAVLIPIGICLGLCGGLWLLGTILAVNAVRAF